MTPLQKVFLLFYLKMENFSAVFKLDLTEENCVKTQSASLAIVIVHFFARDST